MERNVLVVDDEQECLELATISLRLFGEWKVYQAENCRRAIERALELKPDIILLDYYLQDGTGGEIITKIRAEEELKNIPIVVYSGSPEAARADPAITDDIEILAKPLNPESLSATLKKIVGPEKGG
jgi:two-component system cell cycle response regulator DivK